MQLKINKANLEDVLELRAQFLQESNFQFIYNKCHENGWADTWLFEVDGEKAGYGSVWGADRRDARDAIFEFYLPGPFRKLANLIFEEFCTVSGAKLIECQSNDSLLAWMLFEYALNINAEAILFEDDFQSNISVPGVTLSRNSETVETDNDSGEYLLKSDGETAASGGFMLNYNKPYADIYMEVKQPFRQRGFGSLIVQELKKIIYQMGRVPAARCNINNSISKATLLKAGFKVCGAILKGHIKGAGDKQS
ncbi:MAG TPA: GNAT family N-acetyltransferase [Mucilaginibacter sp.]|jgi:RimJ/RimL family protein N-acetyltransferase